MVRNECPVCHKDMTIKAGAVFKCSEKICPYWRLTFGLANAAAESKRIMEQDP